MRNVLPLGTWLMILGAIITGVSGGWSGFPWSREVPTEAARHSITFVVGIALVVAGALLRTRSLRATRIEEQGTPPISGPSKGQ